MCNQTMWLEDWQKLSECPNCRKEVIQWNEVEMRNDADLHFNIECPHCHFQFCEYCGESMDVDAMRDDGFVLIKRQKLAMLREKVEFSKRV